MMAIGILEADEHVNHPAARSKGGADQSPPRVLVVDDEEDLLELVRYNLSKEGYRVECVASGELALKAARREPPPIRSQAPWLKQCFLNGRRSTGEWPR